MNAREATRDPVAFLRQCELNPDSELPASPETVDILAKEIERLSKRTATYMAVCQRLAAEVDDQP